MKLPWLASPPSRQRSPAGSGGAVGHWDGRFFDAVHLQREIAYQLIELFVRTPELMDFPLSGIPHRITS